MNIKATFLYFIYIIAATIFFAWYLFPEDAVKRYIAIELSRSNPDADISIKNIYPVFPPGLTFKQAALLFQEKPMIEAEWVKITPKLLSLFKSEPAYYFKGSSSDGIIKGKAVLTKSKKNSRIALEIDISGIRIQQIRGVKGIPDYNISGNLNGHITYSNIKPVETASIKLTGSDINVGLTTSIFSPNKLNFKTISTEIIMDELRKLQIMEFDIKGNEVNGSIAGHIALKEPLNKSMLDITGTIRPHPSFITVLKKNIVTSLLFRKNESEFSFRITGTIESPRLNWL